MPLNPLTLFDLMHWDRNGVIDPWDLTLCQFTPLLNAFIGINSTPFDGKRHDTNN